MLTKEASERFDKVFQGCAITHAMIFSKERIAFIFKENASGKGRPKDDAELATECVLYNPLYNKDKHGIKVMGWEQGIRNAWGAFVGGGKDPTVFCNRDCETCEFTSDEQWRKHSEWEMLPPPKNVDYAMLRALRGCKVIDGEVYIYGIFRKLYKRAGKQKWMDLTYEDDHPNLHTEITKRLKQKKSLISVDAGFSAVDGFNKNDIYACGDGADLWHYNGKKWTRLDPPTNYTLQAIVCAGDGYVYAAGVAGTIIKGRYDEKNGEKWELLKSPIMNMIHSLAWFKGKVYVGVEGALFTINEKGKIEEYAFPEEGHHQYSFRNVTACDEALLSYGADQALIFDGKKWEQIIGKIIVNLPPGYE